MNDAGVWPPDAAWALSPPEWRLQADGLVLAQEPDIESRFTVANGFLAMRGARDLGRAAAWNSWITTFRPVSWPRCYVAGLFDLPDIEPPVPVAMPAPDWLRLRLRVGGIALRLRPGADFTRTLDLRRGLMVSQWRHTLPDGCVVHVRTLRLAARHDAAIALQAVQIMFDRDGLQVALGALPDPAGVGLELARLEPGLAVWQAEHAPHALALATSAGLVRGTVPEPPQSRTPLGLTWRWPSRAGEVVEFHRLVAVARGTQNADPAPAATDAAARVTTLGWRAVLDHHVDRWARRWHASGVAVAGDAEAARALRFATYHLVSAANPDDPRVSIGARAMTGDAYLGHVFWDTEIYLLPFYTLTWPEAARSLLMYRHRTLPAARARAAAHGWKGAMYAWESADTGAEATPESILGADGVPVPVHTGTQEQHITADIAHAVWNHWQATGDIGFLAEAGAEILIETARFWASRAEPGADGRPHINGVIGPDEYHERVDDNAFTNAMAARNLQCAAQAVAVARARQPAAWDRLCASLAFDDDELESWQTVAAALPIGQDPATGLVEQFRGFFALPRVDLQGRRGAAAAALIQGRAQRTQVSKQADVVALLAVLPNLFNEASVRANFAYYEAQCTHESSLSAALHAVVAARLGETAMALGFFRQAHALDLDGPVGASAGGVHIAAQGGLWQAAVLGFAGVSWQDGTLRLAPRLPPEWGAMDFCLHWQGSHLRVRLDAVGRTAALRVEEGAAVQLEVCGAPVLVPEGETVTVKV
jgi:trehalose/maltose hydrolase-like predicted phosphorylase